MVNNVFFSAVTEATMSRHQLLAWVNESLQANLTKIEEMATGAGYCGMTDYLFPGSIAIKKVKWNSRHEIDWVNNWQVLQQAWKKLGVDKPVPVERLMKAKFQENFEFLQWFRKFFDANFDGHEYDAMEVRGGEEFPAALPGGGKPAASRMAPVARAAPRPAAAPARTSMPAARKSAVPAATAAPARSLARPTAATAKASPGSKTAPTANGSASVNVQALRAEIEAQLEAKHAEKTEELTNEVTLLSETIAALEKERDFYFNKLRAVEVLCDQAGDGNHVAVNGVTQILYETEEGFESNENGEAPIAVNGAAVEPDDPATPEPAAVPEEPKAVNLNETVELAAHEVANQVQAVNLDDSDTF